MKKNILFILAFSFNIVSAQQNVIDSLKSLLGQHVSQDSVRVNLFLQTGEALLYSNPDSAVPFAKEALKLSEKLKLLSGIAASYRQIGSIAQMKGDYVSAIDFFLKALSSLEPLRKNDPNSTELFDGETSYNLGILYTNTGQFEKAIESYGKLLELARRQNFKMQESIALSGIGFAYQKLMENDKAMVFLQQSLKIAEDSAYLQVAAYALNNIGLVLNHKKDFVNAIHAFEKSIDYATAAGDIGIKSESIAGMGETYFYSGDYSRAERYCKQGIELAIKSKSLQFELEMHHLLSDIYKKQNKFDQALDQYQTFITLRDSVINDEKKSEMAKKEMQFEFDKKEALAKAEVSQQRLIKNFTFAGTGILLGASIFSFIFYKRRRDAEEQKKESDFKVMVSETEMKALRSQMNPHFIFNSLNSISDYISKSDLKTADSYLSKFSKVMRMILENSEHKEISLSSDLKVLELYMQLEALRLKNGFTFEIRIDEHIDTENTLVPPLLLQPFVENSIWHGLSKKNGDGKILIQIKKEGEMINCMVEDNGIGREQSEVLKGEELNAEKKSLGMKITKARIDIINKIKKSNAAVELSDLKEGLRVEVRLPLELSF